jgi:hypothetical protein
MKPGTWQKSSRSSDTANCVEVQWHKSSQCDANGGSCVEVGRRKVDRPRDKEVHDEQRPMA